MEAKVIKRSYEERRYHKRTSSYTSTVSHEGKETSQSGQRSSSLSSSSLSSSSSETEEIQDAENLKEGRKGSKPRLKIISKVKEDTNHGTSSGPTAPPRRPRRRKSTLKNLLDTNGEESSAVLKRRHSHAGIQAKRKSQSESGAQPITTLERLIRTHPIWFLPSLSRDEATTILQGKEKGSFVVRQSSQPGTMAVSVRQILEPEVEHYLIQQAEKGFLKLESSTNKFENILSLVYHYSTIKEELPQILQLPQTLRDVDSRQNLASLALLGKDFWRYPMSYPDSKRYSVSVMGQQNIDEIKNSPKMKPKRKISVCEASLGSKPIQEQSESGPHVLDETLCGLQAVSDMLQASLKELEGRMSKGDASPRPPPPPLRSSSHLASPVSSPNRVRRRSDTEAILRSATPPLLPQCPNRSPNVRPSSSRHSVCRMVVTQVSEARFPGSKSPRAASPKNSEQRLSPIPHAMQKSMSGKVSTSHQEYHYSQSCKRLETAHPASELDESPIPVDHSILHDHVLPKFGIGTGEAACHYFRSSVADKMSDYEDIWADLGQGSVRSITPAESESQFKAYLVSKLQAGEVTSPSPVPYNNTTNNNNIIEKQDFCIQISNNNNNTVSSSISSTSSNLSGRSVTSSKISSVTSSLETRSPLSSPQVTRNVFDHVTTDTFSSSSNSSKKAADEDAIPSEDQVYSDPLDALENAEDTRIYNFPEFGEEPIYEEACRASRGQEPKAIIREDNDVAQLEVFSDNSHPEDNNFNWREPSCTSSIAHSASSEEKTIATNVDSLEIPKVSRRLSLSPDHEKKLNQIGKEVTPELKRHGRNENRLSAVIGKYIRPPLGSKTTSWQVDSSSWEFLNETCENEAPAKVNSSSSSSSRISQEVDGNGDGDATQVENNKLEDRLSISEENREEDSESIGTLECAAPASSREQIQSYVRSLCRDPSSMFGQSVDHFVTCTKESLEISPYVVMRNMRQFMTGLKNYLTRSGEGRLWEIVDEERTKLNPDEFLNLDSILEEVLDDLIIQPLENHLSDLFNRDFKRTGCIDLLAEKMEQVREDTAKQADPKDDTGNLRERLLQDFPDLDLTIVIQECQQFFDKLEASISPADKLTHLLTALKHIVHLSSAPQSNINVEKFCLLLGVILSHCASANIEMESEYMWGLLPRPLLTSEAGYYLTLLSSSINFIKTFRVVEEHLDSVSAPEDHTSSLGSKQSKKSLASSHVTTNSLSSTASRALSRSNAEPSSGSSLLKVLIPDEVSGNIVTKTLPIKSCMSSREVRKVIANKMKVTNPEDYALYVLRSGEETVLAETCRPSEMMMQSTEIHFVYRRQEAKIGWPNWIKSTQKNKSTSTR